MPFAAIRRAIFNGRGLAAVASGDPVQRAIDWVKHNRLPGSGIRVHHISTLSTPEVTGYLIVTLVRAGEQSLALDLARWEASIQSATGSFPAPDGVAYTFDTAQVIRGLLAVLDQLPQLETNVRRACDYVAEHIDSSGRVHNDALDAWKLPDGSTFTDYCNLYTLAPLVDASRVLGEPKYSETAFRALRYFKQQSDLTDFKPEAATLSHVFGYMMEALAELGEYALAEKGLAQAERIQRSNGAIPAYPGASWICSTGMAQLAIAWLKLGVREPAERALQYLDRLQHASGGFYGSYGAGASYFPAEEISWAVKFFVDAKLLAAGERPSA